jgi:metal-sulfur cluster biosynthetic enzyme
MTALENKVRDKVNALVDPETGFTFEEMRLIRDLKEKEPGILRIDFRPSSSVCPIALKLAMDIKNEASKVEGVEKVLVYCQDHMMVDAINRIVNEIENHAENKKRLVDNQEELYSDH